MEQYHQQYYIIRSGYHVHHLTINITILEISSSQEKEGVVCHKVAPLVFITQPTSHHHHHHHHILIHYQDNQSSLKARSSKQVVCHKLAPLVVITQPNY